MLSELCRVLLEFDFLLNFLLVLARIIDLAGRFMLQNDEIIL